MITRTASDALSQSAVVSVELVVGGMACGACAARVERTLRGHGGVIDAGVNFATSRARVAFDPVAIGGVMVGAWVLVALIEWAASRADRQPEQPVYVAAPSGPVTADPAWFSPPVEHTLLEGADGDGDTAVTRLPPRLDDAEATVEQRR